MRRSTLRTIDVIRPSVCGFAWKTKKQKNIATTDDEESKACSFRSLLGGREALTNGIEGEGMLRVKLEIISKLFAFWTEVCMHIYIYICISICSFLDET